MRFIKKLFEKKSSGETPQDKIYLIESEKIVIDYSNFHYHWEKYEPIGRVADIKKLPYQKERIKASLLVEMKRTNDTEKLEALMLFYASLAQFQEGVGDIDIEIGIINTDHGGDPLRAANMKIKMGPKSLKWREIVAKEGKDLIAELRIYGISK